VEIPVSGTPQSNKAVLVIALEILSQLNEETEHLPAAMLFCNELSFHFKASRVALGYERDGQIEVVALNQTARFEKRSAEIKDLLVVMDEAYVQDADILWPMTEMMPVLSREHERYALHHGVHTLITLPLRLAHEARGAVTLIREAPDFTEQEVNALRAIVDLSARRLLDLDRYGNQWWKPHAMQVRELCAAWLGPRHTWWKVSALVGTLVLVLLFIIPFPFRVTGDATLKTDALINIPAPFDGYLKEVEVRPGDEVKADQLVAALDSTDLLLRKAQAEADVQHYRSQQAMADGGSAAEGDNATAQMQVYQSQANEANAQLEQIRYDLDHADLKSPFNGVVVEGDLHDKLQSPVKQGDVLLKISRMEDIYVQIDVADEDIQSLKVGQQGEIRLKSRPADVFPIEVTTIQPAAFAQSKGNIFRLEGRLLCPPQNWWRPGMAGVAKIRTGTASLWYILTHKFFDYLLLKFWW